MSFHEIRFPPNLSFGATGGPERRTEIVTLANGHEERNSPWAQSRRRYDAGTGLKQLSDLEELIAFFEARAGQLHGFRWRDWSDWRSASAEEDITGRDQIIGDGDGQTTEFQLIKNYHSGTHIATRPIQKPVAGTVVLEIDDRLLVIEDDFTVNTSTGIISLSVPAQPGEVITAGYEFDVPVRFATDRLDISLDRWSAGQALAVPVVEIRL